MHVYICIYVHNIIFLSFALRLFFFFEESQANNRQGQLIEINLAALCHLYPFSPCGKKKFSSLQNP